MVPSLLLENHPARKPVPLRDVAALVFRHKWLLSLSFFTVVCLALCAALILPRKYESSVKLLVQRERGDTVIVPEQTNGPSPVSPEISEAELNSELELLRTDDLLREVVLRTGLAGANPSPVKIDRSVERLKSGLRIAAINKSNIIGVTYRSSSPQQAANVLNTLTDLFLDKHMQLRRPGGQYQFFDQQAEQYKNRVAEIEEKLAEAKIISPQMMKDKTLEKLADLKATYAQTQSTVHEVESKVEGLKELESKTPQRLLSETRTADNPQLLQNLKSTLLSLTLKRDELLAKYQPTFRPVQDLERQIADTRAAIYLEENKPVREETVNQSSTYEWIRSELAKQEADLKAIRAREVSNRKALAEYNENLRMLNTDGIREQDLLREAKAAETNYLLYSQKREEARISEELDARKILNVVVAQSASVPAIHVHQRKKLVLAAVIVAFMLSLGLVLISDSFDPHYRNPDEVAASLDIPVLAAIPSSYELKKVSFAQLGGNGTNGNSHSYRQAETANESVSESGDRE